MVATSYSVAPVWRFLKSVGVNPGYRNCHHAKVQMVLDGIGMSGLRFGTTDVSFELFECSLDLPPGTIVFDYLLD